MANFHKVQSQHWRNGELFTDWDYFDDFDSAQIYAENITGVSTVKIYSDDNELLHSLTPAVLETYA